MQCEGAELQVCAKIGGLYDEDLAVDHEDLAVETGVNW